MPPERKPVKLHAEAAPKSSSQFVFTGSGRAT